MTAPGYPLQPRRELMVGLGQVYRGPSTTLQTPYLSLHREQPLHFPLNRVGDSSL